MESLILIGNGGHCRSCIEIIETAGKFNIKGIVVHPKDSAKNFMKYKVLGNDNEIKDVFSKNDFALVVLAKFFSAKKRVDLFNLLKKNNIPLATVYSKHSIISRNAFVGDGSIIMNNVIVNSGASVGVNCILNTNALIEHDVKIGNHCHISTRFYS